ENNGNLVYITETGALAVVSGVKQPTIDKVKAPDWKHAMDVKVRRSDETEFKADTKKYGIEVYSDENNGCLLYITETGSLAVLSGVKGADGKSKEPTWKHGMAIAARKTGQEEFKDAKKYGVEVYTDENNGSTFYITEIGTLSAVAK